MDHEKQKLWEKRMKEWEASGLGGKSWCKQQGISECQFWYWKKRLGNSGSEKEKEIKKWAPLVIEDAPKNESTLTVRMGNVEIEVKPGYNAPLLQDVVRTLLSVC